MQNEILLPYLFQFSMCVVRVRKCKHQWQPLQPMRILVGARKLIT